MITIHEVMTRSPHTIGAEQTLETAKLLFAKFNIRHLPVLERGKCVGILSDRDINLMYAVEPQTASNLKISDACTLEVYAVRPDESVKNVSLYMAENSIGSAVVTDGDKVVGIFTSMDACRVLSEQLN